MTSRRSIPYILSCLFATLHGFLPAEDTSPAPSVSRRAHEDYRPHPPHYYLDRTAHWIGKLEASRPE